MAQYQIMYWKEFPAQVKAQDDHSTAKAMLPDYFMHAIDAAAMAEGTTGADEYLAEWNWGTQEERAGSAQEVVDALVAELRETYSKRRLKEMVDARKQS